MRGTTVRLSESAGYGRQILKWILVLNVLRRGITWISECLPHQKAICSEKCVATCTNYQQLLHYCVACVLDRVANCSTAPAAQITVWFVVTSWFISKCNQHRSWLVIIRDEVWIVNVIHWINIQANTKRYVGLMLGQRRRRWRNTEPPLVQRLVFVTGYYDANLLKSSLTIKLQRAEICLYKHRDQGVFFNLKSSWMS